MIFTNNKGKILRVRRGYNPNCSSGMWFFSYYFLLFFGGLAVFIASVIISRVIYKRAISKNETEEILPEQSQ